MKPRDYLQLDVFAHARGCGNPLGVVLDAEDLDAPSMQAIAAWLNLSETTFVLRPTQEGADYRLRIFTPRQELPFAGHPSVGTAHAVLDRGLVKPRDGQLLQECAAGLLPLRVDTEHGLRRLHVRAPRGVERDGDPATVLSSLRGVARGRLRPALIDNGPRWWCIELADEVAVRSLKPGPGGDGGGEPRDGSSRRRCICPLPQFSLTRWSCAPSCRRMAFRKTR